MKKALCIGINHFKRPGNDLAGCVPDANQMGDIFTDYLNINDLTILTDSEAVKGNALAEIGKALSQAKSGVLSYFAFTWSGHGTHYVCSDEEDGLGEALVCYDIQTKDDDWDPATIIKDKELKDLLNHFPKFCTVEVFLDTCYSGGMNKAVRVNAKNRFLHNPGNPGNLLRVANSGVSQGLNSNIVMWCASSEAETSADAYISGGPHGAFTWFWVQEFNKRPHASRVELLCRTRTALKKAKFDQFPRLKCWNAKAQIVVGS